MFSYQSYSDVAVGLTLWKMHHQRLQRRLSEQVCQGILGLEELFPGLLLTLIDVGRILTAMKVASKRKTL